jgi:hypothetical protein
MTVAMIIVGIVVAMIIVGIATVAAHCFMMRPRMPSKDLEMLSPPSCFCRVGNTPFR